MNRIEKILEEVEKKLVDAKGYSWEKTYEKQVDFFKWLLEETEDVPIYEVHEEHVSPTVWGMGDVSHHISIQLQKIKTPASPVILIFDYQAPKEIEKC